MKIKLSFSLFLCIPSFLLFSQTEKGMLIFDGNSSYSEVERTINIQTFNRKLTSHTVRVGKFINSKNCFGAGLFFSNDRSSSHSPNSGISISPSNTAFSLSPFYRHYFNPKKFGFFVELDAQNTFSNNNNDEKFQFSSIGNIGLGIHYFFRENVALEANFSFPFMNIGIDNPEQNLVFNIATIRHFQRSYKVNLPQLESRYLFVRNMYYSLGLSQNLNLSGRNFTNLTIGAGLFLGNYWLFNFQFQTNNIETTQSSNLSQNNLLFETNFFIKLNKNGLYLCPYAGMTNEFSRISSSVLSQSFGSNSTVNVYSSLELAKFFGSKIIVGGGVEYRESIRIEAKNRNLISSIFRITYFINEDVAFEGKANIYISDDLGSTNFEDNRDAFLLSGFDFKIKTFLFVE